MWEVVIPMRRNLRSLCESTPALAEAHQDEAEYREPFTLTLTGPGDVEIIVDVTPDDSVTDAVFVRHIEVAMEELSQRFSNPL